MYNKNMKNNLKQQIQSLLSGLSNMNMKNNLKHQI